MENIAKIGIELSRKKDESLCLNVEVREDEDRGTAKKSLDNA